MQLSVSNLAFTGFEGKVLTAIPNCLGLEIFYEFGNDLYWNTLLKQVFAGRLQRHLSLHGPCIATNLADPNDKHYLEQYQHIMEFAAQWQADFIVVHTNEAFPDDQQTAQSLVKQRLTELFSLARQYPVQLVIENVGLRNKETLLFDWDDYYDLLTAFPQAGALIDTGHAHINGWPLSEVIEKLGSCLKACHLHDNQGRSDDHRPIGRGTIDWKSFFTALRNFAPETTVVFEYANVNLETTLISIDAVYSYYFS